MTIPVSIALVYYGTFCISISHMKYLFSVVQGKSFVSRIPFELPAIAPQSSPFPLLFGSPDRHLAATGMSSRESDQFQYSSVCLSSTPTQISDPISRTLLDIISLKCMTNWRDLYGPTNTCSAALYNSKMWHASTDPILRPYCDISRHQLV